MAELIGTNIISGIVPFSTDDLFATHFAKYGQGGLRNVQNLSERDSIKELRRENLMLVTVEYDSSSGTSGVYDNMIYQLALGTVDDDLTNNSNWVVFEVGSGGDDWILPPPVSTNATGIPGQRSYDDDYIYICIQPNLWKRISMDFFAISLGTSGTAAIGNPFNLDLGDVPIFNGDTWDYRKIIEDVEGTSGSIILYYSDNTTKLLDILGTSGAILSPLSDILGVGNNTGLNDIIIDNGQKIWLSGNNINNSQSIEGVFGGNLTINNPIGSISINSNGLDIINTNPLRNLIISDAGSSGIAYNVDYSINYTNRTLVDKEYVDTVVRDSTQGTVQILTPNDKFLTALLTSTDGDLATNDTLTNTPTDGSYIAVFINGQEFEVGNGLINKACYFSNDGGTNGRGFDSSHPNGQVQTGDNLYWNGSIAGTQLLAGWRISYLYTIDR